MNQPNPLVPAAAPPPRPDSHPAHEGDLMMTMPEVAALIRVPVATLRYWRHLGAGPASFRIGRTVRYWRTDVWAWIEHQAHRSRTTGSPDHQ